MSPEPANILLFGAGGQLGRELRTTLAAAGRVSALLRDDADFAEPERLRAIVQSHAPDMIVNAAAYTAVDLAESNAALAMTVNAQAPRVLAEEAERGSACLVHYSTDFVFDGQRVTPYREGDRTAPLSAYGRSKLDGEIAVAESCRRHIIVRTSWVFSPHGNNFLRTILRLASERDSLRIVNDQVGAPTPAGLIAEGTATILAAMGGASQADSRWGTYHLAAAGETTWHEFARLILSEARERGMELLASADDVAPIATSEYPLPATRPAYSVLDTQKIIDTFGLPLPDWQAGVRQVLDKLVMKQDG